MEQWIKNQDRNLFLNSPLSSSRVVQNTFKQFTLYTLVCGHIPVRLYSSSALRWEGEGEPCTSQTDRQYWSTLSCHRGYQRWECCFKHADIFMRIITERSNVPSVKFSGVICVLSWKQTSPSKTPTKTLEASVTGTTWTLRTWYWRNSMVNEINTCSFSFCASHIPSCLSQALICVSWQWKRRKTLSVWCTCRLTCITWCSNFLR